MKCKICHREIKNAADFNASVFDEEALNALTDEQGVFSDFFGAVCLKHKGVREYLQYLLNKQENIVKKGELKK